MKVLLYFESENLLKTSGIGRAQAHQLKALQLHGIETTTDPNDDYDILHINTYGLNSTSIISKAKELNKPVIYHAHSTEEDFRNSFLFSNQISPVYKKRLVSLYSMADYIITPTPYSKNLLESYGISVPINAISNGIDLNRYQYNEDKVKAFRKYFNLNEDSKVVISVGLYFERKGLLDFIEVCKMLPQYTFIWFGYTNPMFIPKNMKDALNYYPDNLILPGYVKGPIIEGAYLDSDCFFFPSYEETEGIVVLEALASKTKIVLRDIPVYDPWMKDKVNCYMGKNNKEFALLVENVVENKLEDLTNEGYKLALSKSLDNIGITLKQVYNKVLNNEFK